VLETQLHDRRSAWDMQSDGTYVQRRPGPDEAVVSSQEALIADAERRSFEANRLRKRRPRIIPRRPYG
jgi:polyphosphate kinase